MHRNKRRQKITGTGSHGKAVVRGIVERDGEARMAVVPNTKRSTLRPHIDAHVVVRSAIVTDAHQSYCGLDADFVHGVVDHAIAYVDGRVHTNGLENFWSLFKRCIHGTWVGIEPFHLHRCLDEQTWRFNARKVDDGERFIKAVGGIGNGPLPYKRLIGEAPLEGHSP